MLVALRLSLTCVLGAGALGSLRASPQQGVAVTDGLTVMKYTLLDVQRAESAFHREHATYSASSEVLHVKPRSDRVSLHIDRVTSDGFVASTTYSGLAGWTCKIKVGDAADAKTDGVIMCTRS